MMEPKRPDEFRIRFDDAGPELPEAPESDAPQVDRLQKRITLLAVLLPCILLAVVAAAYLDLKNRMVLIDSTGTTEVKGLAKNIESSFSSVSVQLAKTEETLTKRIENLERILNAYEDRLDKADHRLQVLQSTKVDQKSMEKTEGTVTALGEKISAASAANTALQAEVQKLGTDLKGPMAKTGERLEKLEAQVLALSTLRTDLKALDLAVKDSKKTMDDKVSRTTQDLEKKIDELSRRVAALSKKAEQEAAKPIPTPQATKPGLVPAPQKPAPASSAQPSQKPAPSPGAIQEQDIK